MATVLEKAPKRVKVKLKKPHTHAGVERAADQEIEITEQQAKVLKDQSVI
jgi:hypothetical protein